MSDAGSSEHRDDSPHNWSVNAEPLSPHEEMQQAVPEQSEDKQEHHVTEAESSDDTPNAMSAAQGSGLHGGNDFPNGSADAAPPEMRVESQHVVSDRSEETDGLVRIADPFEASQAPRGAISAGGPIDDRAVVASNEQPSDLDATAVRAATVAGDGKLSPPADAPAKVSSPELVKDMSGDPSVCPYADAETVQKLSARLLNTVATGAVLRGLTPGDAIAEMRAVLLGTAGSNQPSKKGPEGLALLQARLEKLEAKRSLSAHFLSHPAEKVVARARELDDHPVCRHSVRQRLAVELVKHFDQAKEWHCGCDISLLSHAQREHHSMSCIFRPIGCGYAGCTAIFSARYEGAHDSICEYKLVPCELNCGVMLPRREMEEHLAGPCKMKPVHCPYRAIGCAAPGLVQGQLDSHAVEFCDAHLRLAVNCILYQQRQIADLLAARQVDREAAAAAGFETMGEVILGLTDLRKRLDTFETKNATNLQKQSKASIANARRVEDAMAARVARLEKELRKMNAG
jgi:hypothetical protein